jgi:hypothetical protein
VSKSKQAVELYRRVRGVAIKTKTVMSIVRSRIAQSRTRHIAFVRPLVLLSSRYLLHRWEPIQRRGIFGFAGLGITPGMGGVYRSFAGAPARKPDGLFVWF